MRYLFALTLPVAVATTVLGEDLLVMLFGEDFRPAAPTLMLLIWTLLPYALVRYNAYILVGAHRQKIDLWINIAMLSVNVVLNALLIPTYGPFGAAVATVIAVCSYATLQSWYLKRFMPDTLPPLALSASVIIGSVLSGVVCWVLGALNIVLAMLVAPVVYVLFVLWAGLVSADEMRLLGLDRFTWLMRWINQREKRSI